MISVDTLMDYLQTPDEIFAVNLFDNFIKAYTDKYGDIRLIKR